MAKKKTKKNIVVKKKVSKKKKTVVKVEELKEKGLSLQQEKFCQLYASDREFFGNGTLAYIEAYNYSIATLKSYKVAQAASSRLLTNVIICERINSIMDDCGFNDIAVDKQHAFLIVQHEDKNVKLGAIREYNKLKKRTSERLELTTKRPFEDLTDEELAEAINDGIKFLKKK